MKKIICFSIFAFGFMFGANANDLTPQDLNSCPLQVDSTNPDNGNNGEQLPEVENKLD